MFNSGRKKEAMKQLELEVKKYTVFNKDLIKAIENIYREKQNSLTLIKDVEKFLNTMTNKPKEFDVAINKIKINIKNFSNEVLRAEKEFGNIEIKSGVGVAAGVATGTAVATLGPTAAMAIATTFGTASTGTLISTLSGAAATNAALAWLGGGALAAGGSGIIGGEALLALAGPIGWAIGGVTVLGSGLYMNNKNKRAAEEIEKKIYTIKKEETRLKKANQEALQLFDLINFIKKTVRELCTKLMNAGVTDYLKTNESEKYMLMTLINETESLSMVISEKLKMENN